jgi:ribosome modulation factor
MKDAYSLGFDAFFSGKEYIANPFENEQDRSDWYRGFNAADELTFGPPVYGDD